MDKEKEIKLNFLEEAQEYLDTMESGLLGLSSGHLNSKESRKNNFPLITHQMIQ